MTTVGSVIAIPLEDKSWGVAVICSMDSTKSLMVLRYYGMRFEELPTTAAGLGAQLKAEEALAIEKVGGHGLKSGAWKVVDQIQPWVQEDWAQSKFTRVEHHPTQEVCVVTEYDVKDPSVRIGASYVSLEEAQQFPADAMSGSGAAELFATDLVLDQLTPYELAFPSAVLSTLRR